MDSEKTYHESEVQKCDLRYWVRKVLQVVDSMFDVSLYKQ